MHDSEHQLVALDDRPHTGHGVDCSGYLERLHSSAPRLEARERSIWATLQSPRTELPSSAVEAPAPEWPSRSAHMQLNDSAYRRARRGTGDWRALGPLAFGRKHERRTTRRAEIRTPAFRRSARARGIVRAVAAISVPAGWGSARASTREHASGRVGAGARMPGEAQAGLERLQRTKRSSVGRRCLPAERPIASDSDGPGSGCRAEHN
jgi:hypothetical protein